MSARVLPYFHRYRVYGKAKIMTLCISPYGWVNWLLPSAWVTSTLPNFPGGLNIPRHTRTWRAAPEDTALTASTSAPITVPDATEQHQRRFGSRSAVER